MTRTITTSPRIVILGGGYAGLTVAQRLSRKGVGARITLIDAKPAFEQRIRLHQIAAGQSCDSYAYRSFLAPLGVEFIQGTVTAIEPDNHRVSAIDVGGGAMRVEYDYLVYALGSFMDLASVPGVQEHADAFDSVAAAAKLHEKLRQAPRARVLVVGGGMTGIETATELVECLPSLQVTLASAQPLRASQEAGGFSEGAASYLNRALADRNIALLTGARVDRLDERAAVMTDGRTLAFDVCIWTIGFKPSPLAMQAVIQTNENGQIMVDSSLRSLSHPEIVAIGDAASASSAMAGPCRMGSATALAMGTSAAKTLNAMMAHRNPPELSFSYLFRNVCLGRDDGVVQFVDHRDIPRNVIWTGAAAAQWKEYICLSTLWTIGLTTSERPPALPPLQMLPQMVRGLRQYA